MKIKVLASGSKGNCTYIESGSTKILLDVGINFNKISNCFESNNLDLYSLDGILISHSHKDHVGGLASLVKKIPTKVFIKEELFNDLRKIIPIENIELVDNTFKLGDLNITLFNSSHDVPNSGYIIDDGKDSFVYITDTGYINRKYLPLTENKTIYMVEFNHDEKMVMTGPYPYILKERILSDKGHLSNTYSASYLSKVVGDKTKYILLAHISENNNTEELAYETAVKKLPEFKDRIIVAKQNIDTEMIEV